MSIYLRIALAASAGALLVAGCATIVSRRTLGAFNPMAEGGTHSFNVVLPYKATDSWRLSIEPELTHAKDLEALRPVKVRVYVTNLAREKLRAFTFVQLLGQQDTEIALEKHGSTHFDLVTGENALIFQGTFSRLLQTGGLSFDIPGQPVTGGDKLNFMLRIEAEEQVEFKGRLRINFTSTASI